MYKQSIKSLQASTERVIAKEEELLELKNQIKELTKSRSR
jgi:hypothetical protein